MNARCLFSGLLASLAVVAVYHVLLRPPGADTTDLEDALARLDTRVQSLEENEERHPRLAGRDAPTVLADFETRLASLEERRGASRATAHAPEKDAAPGDAMEAVERARTAARTAMRQSDVDASERRIRRLDANVAENDIREAAGFLADHAQAVRNLYEGHENPSPEEALRLRSRYDAMRQALNASLDRLLGPEAAGRLSGETVSSE